MANAKCNRSKQICMDFSKYYVLRLRHLFFNCCFVHVQSLSHRPIIWHLLRHWRWSLWSLVKRFSMKWKRSLWAVGAVLEFPKMRSFSFHDPNSSVCIRKKNLKCYCSSIRPVQRLWWIRAQPTKAKGEGIRLMWHVVEDETNTRINDTERHWWK